MKRRPLISGLDEGQLQMPAPGRQPEQLRRPDNVVIFSRLLSWLTLLPRASSSESRCSSSYAIRSPCSAGLTQDLSQHA